MDPDVVQYKPGAIDGIVSSITSGIHTMETHGEEQISALTQLTVDTSGQFTDAIEAQKSRIRQFLEDAKNTATQHATSVTESAAQNAARDQRSANSIS